MKPSVSAAPVPTVEETPPVVAETADTDTQAAYDQSASRRKGLLSTILSRRERAAAGNSTGTYGGNTTLG